LLLFGGSLKLKLKKREDIELKVNKFMETINLTSSLQGETTDVTEWLSRAGLKFEDLGNDADSLAIRNQWREYQAAVRMYCVSKRQPPEKVQLDGIYGKLRVPQVGVFTSKASDYSSAQHLS
jgi:hypothetical protein